MMGASSEQRPWVVGITGASGAIYGVELTKALLRMGLEVHMVITDAGWRVLNEELGWNVTKRKEVLAEHFNGHDGQWIYYPNTDIGARVASGSFRTSGMVVTPCSMGTLSGIARAASDNLLERAADVMLKEGRKLILVPRETPLHAIHLENMLTLSRMGVTILPAMPAFYNHPKSISDLVRFIVGKTMDAMGIDHAIYKRWGE